MHIESIGVLVVVILGALIGSFLNVCIYRIPIQFDLFDEDYYPALKSIREKFSQKISTTFPARSFCPHCQAQLSWYHNIPVFSWLFLGGKCAFCRKPIGIRYPLVELSSALAAILSLFLFDFSIAAVLAYVLFAAFIVITCIDYDHFMIPDVITFPLMGIGVLVALGNQYGILNLPLPFVANVYEGGLGILAGAGSLYFVAKTYLLLRKREGLGLGDVKLLAVTGIFFGYEGAFFTIFIGSLVGSVFGLLMIAIGKKGAAQEIPFGPYLCAANALYIVLASVNGQLILEKLFHG